MKSILKVTYPNHFVFKEISKEMAAVSVVIGDLAAGPEES